LPALSTENKNAKVLNKVFFTWQKISESRASDQEMEEQKTSEEKTGKGEILKSTMK
jgi:hypothetical protein